GKRRGMRIAASSLGDYVVDRHDSLRIVFEFVRHEGAEASFARFSKRAASKLPEGRGSPKTSSGVRWNVHVASLSGQDILESDAGQNPPERLWQAGESGGYAPAGTRQVLEATFRDDFKQHPVALYERSKKE